MKYEYYIASFIVIEYISKDGKICKISTDNEKQKQILDISNNDINCIPELLKSRQINKDFYFENDKWKDKLLKETYAKKIKREIPKIYRLIKVYKETKIHECL